MTAEWLNRVHFGDCLETLRRMPDGIVQTCVTSPPYFGLRDYGHPGQIGLEASPDEFVQRLVDVFREVRRVLRADGTCWVNMGDSYAANRGNGASGIGEKQATNVGANLGRLKVPDGLKEKDLIGVPWMLAFALRADGWWLRQDIIWHKPNPMPESVTDRCTKAHEYVFLLSKSPSYYCDMAAIREQALEPDGPGNVRQNRQVPGERDTGENANIRGSLHKIGARELRNRRSVWSVTTKPYTGAHFATFPPDLIEPCILAGAPAGSVVLDPFMGSGTTAAVSTRLGRQWIGCELNHEYEPLQRERLMGQTLGLELA